MIDDDSVTVCAIGALAAIVSNVLHEGVGHAALALLTGARSGVLSTVAWSSAHDTRLVVAGGTLVNLVAGFAFWAALRRATTASVRTRLFLLVACAFNLLSGTGYFIFSGVTGFGDWADVIGGLQPVWAWRALLVIAGVAGYYGALRLVGDALVRYVRVPADQPRRIRGLVIPVYLTAISLACIATLFNPVGPQLMWQSALPSTAGANAGLVWLQYYVPRGRGSEDSAPVTRGPAWIATAAGAAVVFIGVLGRGLRL
jgi:hypothetical protein